IESPWRATSAVHWARAMALHVEPAPCSAGPVANAGVGAPTARTTNATAEAIRRAPRPRMARASVVPGGPVNDRRDSPCRIHPGAPDGSPRVHMGGTESVTGPAHCRSNGVHGVGLGERTLAVA